MIGVAAYLFRERADGFELLLLRRKSSRYFGEWFPVEGRIEVGETEEETVRREVREETSIEPTTLQRAHSEPVNAPGNVRIHVFFGFVPPNTPVILNDEHSEYEWVAPEEAMCRLPVAEQRKVLRDIVARFLGHRP